MDFKSLLIGFLLAVLMFLLVGLGGNDSSGRYQIRHESNSRGSATIIDTNTGIAKKIYQGKVLETYNFNAE